MALREVINTKYCKSFTLSLVATKSGCVKKQKYGEKAKIQRKSKNMEKKQKYRKKARAEKGVKIGTNF